MTTEQQAATAAVRRAGQRLQASSADVDAVLAALFTPVLSLTSVDRPKAKAEPRKVLTTEQKQRIVHLISEGRERAAVAAEIGCTVSAVDYTRRTFR